MGVYRVLGRFRSISAIRRLRSKSPVLGSTSDMAISHHSSKATCKLRTGHSPWKCGGNYFCTPSIQPMNDFYQQSIGILLKNFSSVPVHSQKALLQPFWIAPVHTSVVKSRLLTLKIGEHVYSF